jgi:acyl-[acyl-carrier-protein]-phospholipid O-acyltransferase/long-chain-fatty-acid--[acyl-carrier-protein] ligase
MSHPQLDNQFKLLETRRFLPLFITQFLGAFNDNIFKNAFVILITYRLAVHSVYDVQTLIALIGGIFTLPFFLFSATAGQIADKYDRAILIVFTKCLEVIIMLFAVMALYRQSFALLSFVLFLLGTQATLFGPLKYAILPDHLENHELVAGNGLIEAGTFLAILIGSILGGVFILSHYGTEVVSVLIVFFALMGLVSSCLIPRTHKTAPQLKINYNFLTETYRVVKYARQYWDIFLAILGISWFWFYGFIFLNEFNSYTKNILHANQDVVMLFFTLFSLGIGVGSLLCNRLLKGKISATYVPLGALGVTLFTVDLFFASSNFHMVAPANLIGVMDFLSMPKSWRLIIDTLFIAISGGLYTVPLYAIVQHRSPPEYRARIIACNNILNALFMVVAAVITLLLVNTLGFTETHIFLTVAILNGIVAIYICKLLPDALLKSFVKWLFEILFRVEVQGLENYYDAGNRFIIIANHTSWLDAGLLAAFMPNKLTFAVNTYSAKKWWIRLFLLMVDAYPLDPTNPMAIKSLIEYVSRDKKCVIFPEGRLTVTGALMKIYEGPGLVADKSKAKILPIRIEGAQLTHFSRLRGKIRLQWFPKITLIISPPQTFSVSSELVGRKRRQVISRKLYDVMVEMLFVTSPYQQTLINSLLATKTLHGENHIIAEDVERKPLTYHQLIMRCFILGHLIARKTQYNENVGILLPNAIANMATFFALHLYGRVPAMLNFSTGTYHVTNACLSAQIKTIYTSRRFISTAKLDEMVASLSRANINVIYLEDLKQAVSMMTKLKGLLLAQFPQWAYEYINRKKTLSHGLNPNAPAVILFTSGSEGVPKGVVLSHINIQANRYQLAACVDFTAIDIAFNALPLFHSFGLTGGMLLPVLSGIKVFFYPSPLHYRIVPELTYDTNATILFGTDTFLNGYAKYAHPYDFYSVRYVFAGAEKLRDETRKVWSQKFGVRILEGYGATETSPVLAANTPMYNQVGTVGRLLPGIRYQLLDVEGVTDGHRFIVSGPNIMLGYLRTTNPGVLEPPPDGWYDTGDIVSMDEAGFITIKGRAKRFAKVAGEMVSLTAVESYINEIWPKYRYCCCSHSRF